MKELSVCTLFTHPRNLAATTIKTDFLFASKDNVLFELVYKTDSFIKIFSKVKAER